MTNKYEMFMQGFNKLDKQKSVSIVHNWLINDQITIKQLYEEVLVKALENLTDTETNPQHKIWFEHIQSSIVRTIIEMAHPFVLQNKSQDTRVKAAVICPDNEQHELGARMINDYLVLSGIQSYFVGRDTPRNEFVKMIEELKLDYVAISVTNYYNLSEVLKTISLINEKIQNIKIIVGGRAVSNNPTTLQSFSNVIVLSSSEAFFDWLKTVKA